MDVGDVKVCNPAGKALFVERKAWPDFLSSLRDNRYREQKYRLFANMYNKGSDGGHVAYLIETQAVPLSNKTTGPMQNWPGMCGLAVSALRDAIPVLYSASTQESAKLLVYLSEKLKETDFRPKTERQLEAGGGYARVARYATSRKQASDGMDWELMLAAISGVSASKAKAIAEAFSGPVALAQAIQNGRVAGGDSAEAKARRTKKVFASGEERRGATQDARGKGEAAGGEAVVANITWGASDKRVGPAVAKRVLRVFLQK
jgi:ERCC4-type nuclease